MQNCQMPINIRKKKLFDCQFGRQTEKLKKYILLNINAENLSKYANLC